MPPLVIFRLMKIRLLIPVTALLMAGCHSGYKKNSSHENVDEASIAKGDSLATKYCGLCHQRPNPDQLNAASWELGVLPHMGPRLGIFTFKDQRYPSNMADPNVGREFYPAKPMLSAQDWKAIVDYYTATSPDSLPAQRREEALQPDKGGWVVEKAGEAWGSGGSGRGAGAAGAGVGVRGGAGASGGVKDGAGGESGAGTGGANRVSASGGASGPYAAMGPATCWVHWEPGLREVMTADIVSHTLDLWDGGVKVKSLLTGGSIVDLAKDSAANTYYVCNMGPFGPNNALAGHIDSLSMPPAVAVPGHGHPMPYVVDSLLRPVSMAVADLNGDGLEDLVVCEFGFIKGELAWMENKGGGRYERHVLKSVSGAIKVQVKDCNADGLPDLWVLFAQGDESLLLYVNKGHGVFEEQRLLSFPPSYGSTYFELDDFNKDGHPDILYTCGDNADFSTVLKPYHGIYIYLNDGRNHFTQSYFFPQNGCYRAMARDFDGDGDLDIASIAFFADYAKQPEEGFVYLENKGGLHFTAHSVPGTECGRWITMDAADVDGDGKEDILLGNCAAGPAFLHSRVDWKQGPPFLLLRNKLINGH